MIRIATCVVCIIFVVLRFTLPFESAIDPTDFFKDAAHIFVGGLFGAGFRCNEWWPGAYHEYGWIEWLHNRTWLYLNLGVFMTVAEVIAFKFHQN
jgi:hypothetical protein